MLAVAAGIQTSVRMANEALGDEWLGERDILDLVLVDLADSASYELTDLTAKFCARHVTACVRERLERDEAALMRSLGREERAERVEDYLSECTGSGRGVTAKARRLVVAHGRCRGLGVHVAREVRAAMDATERVTLDEAKSALRERGWDAERLCWAVVGVESRRHVPLVLKEANMAARHWPDRGADSLIGYAWQGLRLALYNYDPEVAMFSTYACPRIRGAIRDGTRAESHLPKRLTTFVHKVERTRDVLTQRLGRHPTLEEVARAADIEMSRLNSLRHMGAPVSLNDIVERDESFTVVARENPERAVLEHARAEAVAAAMLAIDPEDAHVVQLLILDGLSLSECQARTGLSGRQLRQRKERALEELSTHLAEWADA